MPFPQIITFLYKEPKDFIPYLTPTISILSLLKGVGMGTELHEALVLEDIRVLDIQNASQMKYRSL